MYSYKCTTFNMSYFNYSDIFINITILCSCSRSLKILYDILHTLHLNQFKISY